MADEVGIIDVMEWNVCTDMETGRKAEWPGKKWEGITAILARHPYPGDLSAQGNVWVVDQALEMVETFSPSLMILHFANQTFRAMFGGTGDDELEAAFEDLEEQIDRFLDATSYEPLIVGMGGYSPLQGCVDLMRLDGLALGEGMTGTLAGLFNPTARDLGLLKRDTRVLRLVSRERFREHFGGSDAFYRRFPDYLVELEDGWGVRCAWVLARNPSRILRRDDRIPVGTALGDVKTLKDIRPLVESSAAAGRKVALILAEGWSLEDFPFEHSPCPNLLGWYRHDLKSQLISIFSGKPVVEGEYPPVFRHYREDDVYPFSVVFNEPSPDLLGRSVQGFSAAVGNRSILPHALFGADITVECYARALYNYGSMAVLQGRGLRSPSINA